MNRENIEDIYRLSPIQHGMLFHSLYAPESGVYFEQFLLNMGADFDPAVFEKAWQTLVDQHPILRTSFVWADLKDPVQVVHRQARPPFDRQDWRGLPPEERERRLQEYMIEDRRRGFDLNAAPLLRFGMLRVTDESWKVVWSYHHLLLDGWSLGLLLRDFPSVYRAAALGAPVQLAKRRPFRDYIAWLRRQDMAEAEAYWRRTLAGFTTPTPLVVDRPRSGAGEDLGRESRFLRLAEDETAEIKAWCQRQRLTVSTLAHGAWALLLGRYSQERDVLFGSTVSGRPPGLPGAEAMLGCFINTLPVRVEIPAEGRALPFLQELQARLVELRRYEHSPLVDVQGWSELPRQAPLFRSILVVEGFLDSTVETGGYQRTNYPLTLVVGPDREMLLRIDYEAAHFDAATVDRVLGHLRTLVAGLARDPERRLEDLPVLTPSERERLLAVWNRPDVRFDVPRPLHRWFEERAAAAPEAPAVTFEGETLAYGELNARANRLARHLRRLGVGPESRVGLCVDRSFEQVEGILGILKAGGAYVPLDPRYPASRLSLIVEDSGLDVLVTVAAFRELVSGGPARSLVLLDADAAEIAAGSAENPEAGAGPESLAYVIYTSGSTGRPKGSLLTHANVARLMAATEAWYDFGPEDVWTLFHSFAFDFSVWEIWGALLYGGRLVVVPYWVSRSPETFRELLVRERVTVLNQTPSAFRQLVAADLAAPAGELALKWVIFGGEALELASLAPWFDRHGDRRPLLVNMYGITETTVHVTYREVTRADLAEAGRSPIGVPIPDLRVHLVDRAFQLVPAGVPGEMVVAGAGLARGYLGRPDLTAERFVPDPFGGAGERLYRSGDLARRLPDGELEYLGRIDHQVKIRGFRIELGEIEAALLAHPAVRDAVVLAREDGAGDRRLIAWVVPRNPGELAPADVRDLLKARLPDYMVPAALVEVPAIPLTAHGKVDRKALPDPDELEVSLEGEAAPLTPTEELVAGLWSEILGRERIGRTDNFFDLGGHSLLVTRVLSRVREVFQVELQIRDLFEQPTVVELSAAIDDARRASAGISMPPLRPVSRQGRLPLSFGQERFWFIDRLQPESAAYNIPSIVRVRGRLDVGVLHKAMDEVVRRHESLRTIFPMRDGAPAQLIQAGLPPAPMIDLSAVPEPRRSAEARRLASAGSARPFDLARGPLARFTLMRLGEEEHIALLILHHIVSDGWSMGILIREIAVLYQAFSKGQPSPLPELPCQYADFAAWQREWLQGEILERQIAFWRERLAGLQGLTGLPTDRPRPPRQTFRGTSEVQILPPDTAQGLAALGRRYGATPFMVLLAGLGALLTRHGAQEDLAVGSPIAGRTRAELEDLIGLFLNTLVLRNDFSASPGFGELLQRVRGTTLAAYAHQDIPFEKLVEELSPERNLSHSPFFQMLLVLQNAPLAPVNMPGLTLEPVAIEVDTVKFDLTLDAAEDWRGLILSWRYNRDLFDRVTISRLADRFQRLMEGACRHPELPFTDLPLLSEAELRQIAEWSATEVVYPEGERLLHRLIEEQVERAPEAVAVSFGEEELTYRELNVRANRLAHRLRRLGVGPEVMVGVCAERSLEMVVALLAVLKAGGAYVPLDPSYPADRLAYMLADSSVPVLLTQSRLAGGLPPHDARVVLLGSEDGEAEAGWDADPAATCGPDNLAYMIYTSGSTGRPKGAMNCHRGIVNRLLWMQEALRLDAGDRVLQKTPFSFDVSVWEFFWPLMTGARLVVARPGGHQDPAYLVEEIGRRGITTLHFVPSMLQVFLEARGLDRCASLRRVVCSGEALPAELQRRCHQVLGAPLYNLYGPTEAAVDVSWWICEGTDRRASVPIGRPVANTALHVLDRSLQPVPAGVPGELFIGGVQVGRGYHGRPELTAEKFIPDPMNGGGARLYRTGDLARHLPDGAIDFLGRIDHQVKIRGFRIELGEIEATLAAHPSLREAVVIARDQRLVAYVVGAEGAEVSEDALRARLAASLPEYMVPSVFVVLDSLPLSPNGKVDRRALPEPGLAAQLRPRGEVVAPRTRLEAYLARVWSEALGLPPGRLGVHDSFFGVGGNSITGAVFVNRLQERLGEIVHVVALFDAPVLEDFAAFLTKEYPEAVARIWGEGGQEERDEAAQERPVDEELLAEVRLCLRTLAPFPVAAKNPPAVFLLSPPRSGSTLLRVMLGGHPLLFAPPELELLEFNTLAERRQRFEGRDSFRREGLLRAVMEIQGRGPENARALIAGLEEEGITTQEMYRQLQEWLHPRLLVDKTPTYAWDPAALRRAEDAFEGALYLHLVRHPYGMIRSFEEARIDQIFFAADHPYGRRELAEALWTIAHRNILDFLAGVPEERQLTLRFEDLLQEPEGTLRRICAFLGIHYHPAMAEPYQKGSRRMTDGLYAESRMLGDVKFHEHQGVEADVAERWREVYRQDFLGDAARGLAARLGYDVERAAGRVAIESGGWTAGEPLPLSFSQERLWFLDQLDPGTRTYNVSTGVRLSGRLETGALARSLEEIVRRHAVLRTTFAATPGGPVQIVAPGTAVALPLADLTGLPREDREREGRRAMAAHIGEPFDLARGPLLRAVLLRLDETEHWISFTAHHIVCDGWSIGVLVRELGLIYAAFAAGRPSPLPELAAQYADFARWQRRELAGEALEGQIAYWRERLAGVPALRLPGDRPRPTVQSFRGSTHGFSLPADLSSALRALSRERGATVFMTLLAAFQVLLARLSGQSDFAVGSPVAGRNRRELEPLVGFFVNTLVLRADLAGPDFRSVLDRARALALEAYAHQDVPFEKLVQELSPERNLSYTPLFQVMLAFQNAGDGARLDLPGLSLAPLVEEFATSKFDISLTAFDQGPRIFGQWVYSVALFEAATIARWAGSFQTLLAGIAAGPERPVAEISLLTAEERRQLLVEWNRPPADYPDEGFVHRLFEEQVARTPEAVAVVFEGESLSYRELNARANRWARHLRRLGVGPEALVGISAERSFEMVAGLLAILKAGGAYVPLDPALPAERLSYMVEDAGIGLLLTQERLLPFLPLESESLRTVVLDAGEPAAESPEDLGIAVLPENPAYVIYTSGSTGQPKGVVISHRALGNRLQYARAGDVTAADAFLQKTTISFDVSVLEIFAPLIVGGRTVLARPGGQQDPVYLVQYIREQGITYTSFPPSLLYVLFEQEGFDRCHSLRTVITGGETVPAVLPGQFYERLPGADLLNRYGPTEATISVTSWLCERDAAPRTLPIGRPSAKARVYLLDAALQPVPVGVAGELHLGGLCLARGYLRRPALTAERFIPDPFAEEAGARLYRTGDLARYRADGAIEFVGRVDSQVKIRGFRVELGEIEAALARHPGVREVAVVDREDGPTRSLAAYVVSQPVEPVDENELRRFLGETLPAYMVPSDFVALEALPLAPTGKVDRQALPAPDRRGAPGGGEPPRNPTEELLAGFWMDLLALERVGVHDSFFDLGGHSLLATQAMSRVREAFGVDLPLRLLFERPTVAALAAEIDAAVRAGAGVEAPPLVPADRDEDPPLSFAQERLWFLDRLQPGTSAYNLPLVLRLHGALSVPAFAAGLREVARRHESLRTTFAVRDGRPVQVIAPATRLPVPLIDLRALPAAAREAAALSIARETARRPFDLEAGPLLRAVLVRLAADEHLAAVAMHHIVSDGWSVGLMIREVAALYGAALAGTPSPLPEPTIQYADFARWQRDWLQGEALAAEISFWRQRLAGAPPVLELPADRPRPAVQRFRGASLQRVLAPEVSREMAAFCRRAGSTPFMALLAGFQALIHRYTGRRDVVVGTPVAGRDRLETESLIGFFLNSLVMRTGLDGDPGFLALLERVRGTALEAYVHQSLPFEKLVEELAPERSLSHAPLFQTMLVFQNTPQAPAGRHGLTFTPVELETDTAKFDLTLNARESAGGLVLVWLYNRDLFDAATVARLSGHLETLLAAAVADPDRPISGLPLLTPGEEEQIREWNATAAAYPAGACLHELIEAQAGRTPDAVALVCEERALTYRELNAAANRLAHRLTSLGVGPEVPVGVFAERSVGMVVGLLAILKAGGAYLPVDPDYPADRVAYMLEDSAVPVLLTQESLAARLPEVPARVLALDGEEAPAGEEANPASGVRPDHLAYVIYTSGSTGRPKGTMNTHRGIVNRLLWMQEEYGLTPDDRVLQKTPFSFDVSVWEFFWPLMTGARLVMARPGGHRDAAYLIRTIRDEGITTLHFVPSMLQVFLEAPGVEECVSLKRVIASGEALPYELQRRFFRRLATGLHNLYGPTEAAVDVTSWPCEPEGRRGVVPIGRPVANTRIHLLDPNLRPVPVGVAGELYIGGVQVARGYLGRPALTAERFVPDPFAPEPGARLYRTGDLARYLPDGAVDFLGRIDHQVKLRGLRIELGEIEAAIAAHPAIREAVVLARQDEAGVNLAAYITHEAGEPAPTPAELREVLSRSLPEYMIPSAWVVLESMPLSPNGKADRKVLARIAPERTAAAAAGRVAPRDEVERALAGLWSQALGGLPAERFGVHDSFFDLGGNSISAAILINRLQEMLGEIVHVVAIFDAPTIAALAAHLAKDYPEAVARVWGTGPGAAAAAEHRELDEARVEEIRGYIRALAPARLAAKNPPAVFVLSPPRSGSTLLRVMLAGHPGLFAPPELELLSFNTLPERRDAFPGRDAFRLEGLLRAAMEVRGIGPEEARTLVEGFERDGMTVQELYRRVQEWIHPRLLVDKTPTYAWDPATLRRAEEAFEGARYIHLVRHPYGMIHSFEEARIDQIFFAGDHPFGRRELAEALWGIAHRNILGFLEEVPAERQRTVRFEDLLRAPEATLREICELLGLPYDPAMAEPYQEGSRRMTDGLYAESRMLGDVKFHEHGAVRAGVAGRWRQAYSRDFLAGSTWSLASRLGYDVEKERVGTRPPSCLSMLRPGTSDRPLFLVHPLSGELLLYRHLVGGLPAGQAVYGFQARGLFDGERPLERIEDMADLYTEALLAFQPQGPYQLAGSSMGGLIAFEMARRLRALGREVALTVLIDAPTPGRVKDQEGDGEGETELDVLRYATGGRTAVDRERLRGLTPDERLELVLEEGRGAGAFAGMDLAGLRRLVGILEANRRAMRDYRPEPAEVRVTYIRASEGVRADAAWKALALEGLEVSEVAGAHLSMHFPPHVEALAARLAESIARADVIP